MALAYLDEPIKSGLKGLVIQAEDMSWIPRTQAQEQTDIQNLSTGEAVTGRSLELMG